MSWIAYGYDFEGPYVSPGQVPEYAGVYIVSCYKAGNEVMLDVGKAENIRERLENHDRKHCWAKNSSGAIYYYVTNVPDQLLRGWLERAIRQEYKPLCGEE